MARRNFLRELEIRIAKDSVMRFKKPADTTRLVEDSGYIKGLDAAKVLFEDIVKHNAKEREEQDDE